MKLGEIKLVEGLVDAAVLMTIASIAQNGITDGAQTVALARSIMAIQAGYVDIASNFPAYYNEFFPSKAMLDELKALSKGDSQRLASLVYHVLKAKDEQVASFMQTAEIVDMIYYSTAASSNE